MDTMLLLLPLLLVVVRVPVQAENKDLGSKCCQVKDTCTTPNSHCPHGPTANCTCNTGFHASESTCEPDKVGFHAYFPSPQSYTISLGQVIIFPTAITNVGNGYNTSSGLFTAPYAGLYVFQLHFMSGIHFSTNELAICRGGNDSVLAIAFAEGSRKDTNDQGACTTVVQLAMGDPVYVKLYHGSGALWGSPLTSFSGILI